MNKYTQKDIDLALAEYRRHVETVCSARHELVFVEGERGLLETRKKLILMGIDPRTIKTSDLDKTQQRLEETTDGPA